MIGERIAELVEELMQGETAATIRILKAHGKTVTVDDDGVVQIQFPGGEFACALKPGDGYPDQLPMLMFALFGPLWALVVGVSWAMPSASCRSGIKRVRQRENRW